MDHPQDFKSLQHEIQAALITTTRTAGKISSEDLGFHRSLNPEVGTSIDEQNSRLLALSSSLLKSASSLADIEAPLLKETDDIDNHWRGIVDVVDSLLERADSCLDEYTGVIKRRTPPTEQPSASKLKKNPFKAFRTQNIVKPQLAFNNKPQNDDIRPWKPILTSKPHAIKSLDQSLGTIIDELQNTQYKHPYETEILELKYRPHVYQTAEPIPYLPADSTTATFVDSFEGVLEMLAELKKSQEIAVDLEHHDARSYVGLVSLMQISTRDRDWIVDTLKPWREDLQVLNEVFADPNITKVFHGAYMDIVWLQRDLGLYIVGLFDTYHACRVLGYPGGSLAYLLKRFVDFDADKQYQLADWRIRPLPDEMFYYARADTHYLLFIFDNLRNELIAKSDSEDSEEDKIGLVLQKSKETSLLRYERQTYDEKTGRGPGGWYSLLAKTPALFNNEQFAVFRAVHAFRDELARKSDDSTNFIMPNHIIFSLAKIMPDDLKSLFSLLKPCSQDVKSRGSELLKLIKEAKDSGVDGPSIMEILRPDSVGAILNATKAQNGRSGETGKNHNGFLILDRGPLRSEKSVFWGGAFGSSTWDRPPTAKSSNSDMKLAIPLPQLASEAFADGLTDRSLRPPEEERSYRKEKLETSEQEVFTVKSGKKRKIEAISSMDTSADDPTAEYDISLHDTEEEKALEKAARKAERKAQKKAEKAQRKLAASGEAASRPAEMEEVEEEEEEEGFDYARADSILHGKRIEGGGLKGKKPFDPYTKSADAPKGMRKLQAERPGKSFTFKS